GFTVSTCLHMPIPTLLALTLAEISNANVKLCDTTGFMESIGKYSADDLNAVVATVMGEGSPYGTAGYKEEYHAIASTVFNRAENRNDGKTTRLSVEAGNGQFLGYTKGVEMMYALSIGDAGYFSSQRDVTGIGGYRAACKKLEAAKAVVREI